MQSVDKWASKRADDDRSELIERLSIAIREDGRIQPMSGLHLHRSSTPTQAAHGTTELSLCVIAQGSKEVLIGDDRFRYDPAHYLLVTVALPVVSRLIVASRDEPYLSVRLTLEPAFVSSVMLEAGHTPLRGMAESRAINVSPLDAGLLDATVRLVRLLENPAEYSVLAPLIKREIVYRLLLGDQGSRLRHMALLGGQSDQIARAVERIRSGYDKPLRIDTLARELAMSTSGFHHQFKAVTAMTPLQFQKQLRLQEARRLMLSESVDAASAGYKVGYDDASHFNREYKRLFGMPPLRDVERLRETLKSAVTDDAHVVAEF